MSSFFLVFLLVLDGSVKLKGSEFLMCFLRGGFEFQVLRVDVFTVTPG